MDVSNVFLLMAKRKDVSTRSADASVLRRSSRDTSTRKQPTSVPENSGRIEKHTSPSPSPVKSKLDKTEKQMEASPLRRSDRGKKLTEITDLPNNKSKKEKTANNSKQNSEDVNDDDNEMEKQDPDAVSRKRKRFTALRYKALFKPQRIRIESDVDKELITQNSIRDEGAPDKDHKTYLERGVIDLDPIEHGDRPQLKSLDGKSIESGDVEKKIGGNVSPSNGNVANSDNHMFHPSSNRIEHDLENQQESDTCHKVTGTCKAAGIAENAENDDVLSNMHNTKFVEFWVPVPISNVQLEQYCATLLSIDDALRSNSKSDTLGALKNVVNINRKCCNHPYIIDSDIQRSLMKDKEQSTVLDVDIKASGKLQFLDHVLPEIKRRQLKVLILFQFTSGTRGWLLGDILVRYVLQRYGPNSYEHVDGFGSISSKKQASVNVFNKEKSRFIFLLESRSCHPSIKLSSVDVIIIFDSDLNPSNDLKSLQKLSIDSQTEQILIFRLYTSSTLEEKVLKLAENNIAIAVSSHNFRSNWDALLTWGASELFDKLTEFHSQTALNISSEESLLKDVVEEFLYIISHKCKSNNTTSKATITQVQNYGIYGSEIKTHLPEGDQAFIFWKKLLEGRSPVWKFVSESTPRQRKRRRNLCLSSPKGKSGVDGGGVKARRKTVNNYITTEPDQLKTATEGETGGVHEGVPAASNESQSSSGDQFWSSAVNNETSLLDLLKPTVSELCNVLNFSDDVKRTVQRFLNFVLDNFKVNKEYTTALLQAFMISVCCIGSSLQKQEIDRSVSFALAKKHLNFSCTKEEADSVYIKMGRAKEAYLQHTPSPDCLKDSTSAPEGSKQEIKESRHISNVDAFENHKSHENVTGKGIEEFEKIQRERDIERVSLESDYNEDKFFIYEIYSNPSIRSEKLKVLEREFANKLEEHEKSWKIRLEDLKATMMAAEGQVTADHDFSWRGSQYETQVMHSGNPEVAPTLPENPIEVLSHDEPVCEGANDLESIGSHTSEKEMVDTTVSSEQIGEVPAQHLGDDMGIDVTEKVDPGHNNDKQGTSPDVSHAVEDHNETGANDMARHGDSVEMEMPAGVYSKENDEDGTVSPDTSHVNEHRHNIVVGVAPEVEDGEIYLDKPHVCDDHNDTNPIDEPPHVEYAELKSPVGTCDKENTEHGEIYPDKQDVCDNHNETSPRSLVESAEMRTPAGTCEKENAVDGEINPDKPDVGDNHDETSSNDVLPRAESVEMEMPAGACDKENTEDGEVNPDKPDVGDNHDEPSSNDVLPRAESVEMEMPVGACDKENTEDGEFKPDKLDVGDKHNETSPDDVPQHVESAEMETPADACDIENAEDGEINPDKPNVGDNHNKTSPNDAPPRVELAEMETLAGICDKENAEEGEIIHDKPDGDYNEISPNDVLPRLESAEIATPTDNEENAEDSIIRPDALHVNEDHNDACVTNTSNSVCEATSHDRTPAQPVSSPASDHVEPSIPEIQNEPLQLERLLDGGVQDEEVNIINLQPPDAIQLAQMILDDESDFLSFTDPVAVENPSVLLPPSGTLLEPTREEPALTVSPSGENLEENIDAAASAAAVTETLTPHEEHQPRLATYAVPAPPVNALNMFDNIINQVSFQMPNQTDPLLVEVERLRTVKDNVTKFYQETKQRLDADREKEIEEAVAEIKLKYKGKHLEADTAYSTKKMELETNISRVTMNKILAEAFRSKCQDVTPSGHPGMPQVSQAGFMQTLQRLSVSPSVRHYQGTPLSSPGQSSGNQQPLQSQAQPLSSLLQPAPQPPTSLLQPSSLQQPQPRPRQPPQIVHQPAALFSSRLSPSSRPPPMVNQSSTPPTTTRQSPMSNQTSTPPTTSRHPPNVVHITPSSTPTASRPRLSVNTATSSITPTSSRLPSGTNKSPPNIAQIDMSAANLRISTETRGQSSHTRPLVSSEPRAPATHMRPSVSNEPRAPLHIRPLVSNEPRAPPLHIRPLVSNEPRATPPHLRSVSTSEYRAPAPHMRQFRSVLPRQHVTSGLSPSSVLPPPSTSSQPPHSEPCTVPPSAPAPLLSSFDNLIGPVDNARRWVNVVTPQLDGRSQIDRMAITDLTREDNAQSSAAHDLVCLSDDD